MSDDAATDRAMPTAVTISQICHALEALGIDPAGVCGITADHENVTITAWGEWPTTAEHAIPIAYELSEKQDPVNDYLAELFAENERLRAALDQAHTKLAALADGRLAVVGAS